MNPHKRIAYKILSLARLPVPTLLHNGHLPYLSILPREIGVVNTFLKIFLLNKMVKLVTYFELMYNKYIYVCWRETMTIREQLEQRELEYLSPYATKSRESKGRKKAETECDLRPVFQRDRDRILHSKSFRRLKQKTQVFLLPMGDHYRTRLTHTLEVSQNARTIAKALRLNEDLVEAISLCHDLGHTPFGHAGERALDAVCPFGFKHNEQSVRVVQYLEKDGKGLNLTEEVIDGILTHQTASTPMTLEGQIVRMSDKIAYVNHDIDDAIRGGILLEADIPPKFKKVLGSSTKERLNKITHDVIVNSMDSDTIRMSEEVEDAMIFVPLKIIPVTGQYRISTHGTKRTYKPCIYPYGCRRNRRSI